MDNVTPERWLPVVGFEGYYDVSNRGRVRSIYRPGVARTGRVLKKKILPNGYVQVSLSVNGKVSYRNVHRLVARAFRGPCPEGEEVLHGDDDRANNRLDNLSYGTHKINQEQMVARGRARKATATHCGRRHEYTPESTGYDSKGRRYCRICMAMKAKERYEANKHLVPVTLICPWCGTEFIRPMEPGQGRRRYCTPECSAEAKADKARAASARQHQEWMTRDGPECTTPGCGLPQIVKGKCKRCYGRKQMADYRARKRARKS